MHVSSSGEYCLSVLRPDGRTIAVIHGRGTTVIDLAGIPRQAKGIYLLRILHDGAVESKAMAAY